MFARDQVCFVVSSLVRFVVSPVHYTLEDTGEDTTEDTGKYTGFAGEDGTTQDIADTLVPILC